MPFLPCFASFKRKDKLVLLLVFVVLSLRTSSQITNIGIENGMSNNSVTSICQDRKGFMWFATNDGLNRYDGYHFKIFRSIVNDTNSMISNRLTSIRCDENDNLWIGTKEGLCRYNLLSSKFNRFSYTDYATKKTVPLNVFITDILVRKDKSILVATGGNGLVKFDGTKPNGEQVPFLYGTKPAHNHYITDMAEDANTGLVYCFVSGKGLCVYSNGSIKILNSELKEASSIALDGAGSIWISWQDGLHQYDIATNKYTRLLSQSNSALLNNIVYDIYIDSENKMWILTDGSGISILNLKDLVFENTNKLNSKLSSLATTKAFKDREGRLWLGTLRGGVSIYDTEKTMFENKVVDTRGEASGLVSNFILSFYEDQQGKNIWVGTDGYGVSIWNRETDRFTTFSHNNNPSSLSHNFVTGITGDYLGNIWLATFGGGVNRYKKESNSFEHYPLFNGDREDKDALRVYEDSRKNLWVSTMQYGLLYLLNRATNKFEVFNKELREVLVLSEDNEGQLWAGNYNKKLVKIDIEKKIYTSYDIGNLPRAIMPDRNGGLWIGTEGGGLLLFDKQKGSIKKQYTEANGLSNNFVLNILSDSSGNLWMSTFNGISKFNPTTEKFDNYYQADGLVGNEFNYNAAVKLKNGFMMFGGIKGITMFDPSTIKSRKYFPPVYLSSFSVEGTPLKDSAYVAKQNGAVPNLKLKFSEATVSFDFVALEYSLPSKISYAYFLEGWDKEWNITNRPSANYSHIAEGRYILKVKSTNAEGEFGKETAVLEITVLPPWYRSWWAYLIYVLIIGSIIYIFNKYKKRQERLRYEVKVAQIQAENERQRAEDEHTIAEKEREIAEKEKQIVQQEREINEKRVSFFTNIAHEFRSPLTLILNPVEDMMKNRYEMEENLSDLKIIYRNSKRLLSLVNQLLLFRKAESSVDKLKVSKLNIQELCHEVFMSFQHEAKMKNIKYSFTEKLQDHYIYADREKTEIMLYNLISNAIKYTPNNKAVAVSVTEHENEVEVLVSDTGNGFPQEIKERIFEKFFRADRDDKTALSGFGIGLYLVKNFIELHHGSITTESTVGQGASFSLKFLKGFAHFEPEEIMAPTQGRTEIPEPVKPAIERTIYESDPSIANNALPTILSEKLSMLVVDDDEEMRTYLGGLFNDDFIYYEARDGKEGIAMARQHVPDIIISDIAMPGITGIEFCKMIKSQPELAHIPFLLLTGSGSPEMQLQGAEEGADDYLTKPFSKELLIARVNSLLKNREKIHQFLYDEATHRINDLKISEEDKVFLDKCIEVVEAHLTDEQFSIEVFAADMFISHSSLYKRIKQITGYSANQFIRFVRLRKAAKMFIDTGFNVNEIAFEVGIGDVKYFREQFSKLFNMNPSEYIKKYRKKLGKNYTNPSKGKEL